MTKRQLIDEIITKNQTAQASFLAQFADDELREGYLAQDGLQVNVSTQGKTAIGFIKDLQGYVEAKHKPALPNSPNIPTIEALPCKPINDNDLEQKQELTIDNAIEPEEAPIV